MIQNEVNGYFCHELLVIDSCFTIFVPFKLPKPILKMHAWSVNLDSLFLIEVILNKDI